MDSTLLFVCSFIDHRWLHDVLTAKTWQTRHNQVRHRCSYETKRTATWHQLREQNYLTDRVCPPIYHRQTKCVYHLAIDMNSYITQVDLDPFFEGSILYAPRDTLTHNSKRVSKKIMFGWNLDLLPGVEVFAPQ